MQLDFMSGPTCSQQLGFVAPHDLTPSHLSQSRPLLSKLLALSPVPGTLCSAVQRNSPEGGPQLIPGNNPAAQ